MSIFYPTIGLEIHAQLNTFSKMFSGEKISFGDLPNTNVGEITLALPGTLPSPNLEAIKKCILVGLACKSQIAEKVVFHRKNYTYPDLPKGYQISQDNLPLCSGGFIEIDIDKNKTKKILLKRIHIEEDTGKSFHCEEKNESHLDFNRAGSPLIEIVTEPCISSAQEAYEFVLEVRKLVRYLEICDGNMEEGSLRCDVNISISKTEKIFGQRVEIKNLNSIKGVMMAINYEIERQEKLILLGKKIQNETRSYIAEKNETITMREKDSVEDYRYFIEPNIPPLNLEKNFIEGIQKTLPLLPREYFHKFVDKYNLNSYDAKILSSAKDIAIYFEAAAKVVKNKKTLANIIIGPIKAYINKMNINFSNLKISSQEIASLCSMIDDSKISFSSVQIIFEEMIKNPTENSQSIAEKLNLILLEDIKDLSKIIDTIFKNYPEKILAYKSGQIGLLNFFLGQVMKSLKTKIDPKTVKIKVEEKLNEK